MPIRNVVDINFNDLMEKETDYDNDALDPSEEYCRMKKKGNDIDSSKYSSIF